MSVVLIHTSPIGIAQAYIRPFINMGVALFIFLSGYLTSFERINSTMQKRRILRVLIPYVIWISIYTLAHQVASGHGIHVLQWVKNLLTSNAGPQFYFILVYIELVLLLPYIKKLALSRYAFLGWIITPFFTIIFQYIPLFCGFKLPSYIVTLWGDCFLGWFLFYYLGLMIRNKRIVFSITPEVLWGCYVVSLLIQIVEGIIWYKMGEMNCGTQLKLSSYLSSFIFSLLSYKYIVKGESNRGVIYRSLKVLGDCSFGIYLCHILILVVIRHYFSVYAVCPFLMNTFIILGLSLFFVQLGQYICTKRISDYFGFY